MNGATGDRDWLQRYLFESVRKNLCTRIRCTTCGAGEFRNGLLYAAARAIGQERFEGLDETSALVIVRALGRVHPVPHLERQTEEAIRLVLFNIWTVLGEAAMARKFEPLLAGSWAGGILERMKAQYKAESERRKAIAEFQDPVCVQQRQEEKRARKEQKHKERLALKKERDRIWREKQNAERR